MDITADCISQLFLGLERALQARTGHFQKILFWERIWLDLIQERTDNIRQIRCIIDRNALRLIYKDTENVVPAHLSVLNID